MSADTAEIADFLGALHPYDTLTREDRAALASASVTVEASADETIFQVGDLLLGLYLIIRGEVEVHDPAAGGISILGPRNGFGERGLLGRGHAITRARARTEAELLLIPRAEVERLMQAHRPIARFYGRARPAEVTRSSLVTLAVRELMTANPVTCGPETTLTQAARLMRDRSVSSLIVQEAGRITGIASMRDLSNRALAEGLSAETPLAAIMTRDVVTLPPDALCADVLYQMLERRIGHIPVVDGERLVGIISQTDLTRYQAISSASMIHEIAEAADGDALARVTAHLPALLVQLVSAGNRHDIVTRLITDIADAVTRRLLTLAEARLGRAPVPYLWLACGSQGRQEQTGVSDQDNCLILDDRASPADMAYFADMARFVSDGLDACGYYYCPGDMMATAPRWCQPLSTWRVYFAGWIRKPDPMAQMLASVMFDLRPIAGDESLYHDLIGQTLQDAAANSIFVAHMVANSLKHAPPLGLFRGISTIRSGEHKDTLDLKHSGVVPVVDLGRLYAIEARLRPVNTRARLLGAIEAGAVSGSGGRDLTDAYDLIAGLRLRHQAGLIQAGRRPDNFMAPGALSDLEQGHLRDAFAVIKTMQSALGHSRAALT